MIQQLTREIAKEFARRLRLELGSQKMAIVILRNKAQGNSAICHSHDFCDANEVMADAFAEVVKAPFEINRDSDLRLWNLAWSLAKSEQFKPRRVCTFAEFIASRELSNDLQFDIDHSADHLRCADGFIYKNMCYIEIHDGGKFYALAGRDEYTSDNLRDVENWLFTNFAYAELND